MNPTRTTIACWIWMGILARAVEPFFFVQLSDPQFGMYTTNASFAQETANFEFAVAAVNRLKPAFVVITGDLVNKPVDAAQIAEFKRIAAKFTPGIPVYNVPGNHDIENEPTPATVAAYTNQFGADHYSFRHGSFVGIVINSTLVHTPEKVPAEFSAQESWLKSELERARKEGAQHIVLFQHHSWFLAKGDEADQYFNIPLERRSRYLALLHEFGVKYAFCGHYHRNALGRDGDLEVVTSGPVGKPLGNEKSGLRIAIVRDDRIEHRYYDFGDLPRTVNLKTSPAKN